MRSFSKKKKKYRILENILLKSLLKLIYSQKFIIIIIVKNYIEIYPRSIQSDALSSPNLSCNKEYN